MVCRRVTQSDSSISLYIAALPAAVTALNSLLDCAASASSTISASSAVSNSRAVSAAASAL
jgi:hypothetical protein